MTPDRRGFGTALLLVVLAGAALLVSTAGPWVTGVEVRPAPLPDELVERSGGEVAPAVRALGLVALAGVPALLATRGRGRLAIGAVLVLAGVGAAASAVGPLLDPSAAGGSATAQVVATARPWLALAGALTALVAGALTLTSGRRWPALGRRYEAPGTPAPARPERHSTAPDVDGAGAWDALDRGEDPTGR